MKKKKISGVLIYLFCFALGLLLYMNFSYTPLSNKVTSLNSEHSADAAQIQLYEQQSSQLSSLKAKIAELQSQLEKAKTNTAVTGENAAEDIGSACKAAGVVPKSISVGDEVVNKGKTSSTGKSLCSVPIDLEVSCNGTQLQILLNYFEKQSSGAYYVNTVSYKQEQGTSDVTLSLTLYYFSSQGAKG